MSHHFILSSAKTDPAKTFHISHLHLMAILETMSVSKNSKTLSRLIFNILRRPKSFPFNSCFKRCSPLIVLSPAKGNWLPCEVIGGVPLCRYHGPELGMEPAPRHQGSSFRGGPALLGLHLQLHHVSRFIVVPSRSLESLGEKRGWTKKSCQQVVCLTVRTRRAR